ncbi:ROK family protein [Enterococcus gilvus]|uniref:ROK family protein n=1 Tax=Enterococcus gilvus TaxID=160453 RepID=UPI003D6A2706
MRKLLVIDIGGTTVKYGIWKGKTLEKTASAATPKSWIEMKELILQLSKQADDEIEGIAISCPGAVDTKSGIIYGASAIDYIHRFPIREELSKLVQLPVSIQNDANCAALAEVWCGNAKEATSSAFLIIGSGIGGAIVIDNELKPGAHLFGGEFGFMIIDSKTNQTLSEAGSPVSMSNYFSKKKNDGRSYSGLDVFALAEKGDVLAKESIDRLLQAITIGAFNLSVTVDPEVLLIGGAISQNTHVIKEITTRLKRLIKEKKADGLFPCVKPCRYLDKANMIGAVYQFNLEN